MIFSCEDLFYFTNYQHFNDVEILNHNTRSQCASLSLMSTHFNLSLYITHFRELRSANTKASSVPNISNCALTQWSTSYIRQFKWQCSDILVSFITFSCSSIDLMLFRTFIIFTICLACRKNNTIDTLSQIKSLYRKSSQPKKRIA